MAVTDLLWQGPLPCLLLGVGLVLTLSTRGIQFRGLPAAFRHTFAPVKPSSSAMGDVSPLATLCTSLSATVGIGNLVGVSTAIAVGGPGALFWMLVAGVLGMATKYAEGYLAVRTRGFDRKGNVLGGPFCYIEQGLSRCFPGRPFPKLLSLLFALSGALAALLGIGTVAQSGGMAAAVNLCFPSPAVLTVFGHPVTLPALLTGAAATLLAAAVLMGGVRRISAVSTVLVPLMTGLYITLTLSVLVVYRSRLPASLLLTVQSAFCPKAALGGVSGIGLKTVLATGLKRGIFANEAGLGSTPIAAAAALTDDPKKQGLIAMSGTFVDTVLLCTLTGLAVTVTGVWQTSAEGFALTVEALSLGLPIGRQTCTYLLSLCLCFFAFTSITGWHYYGERCFSYLTGGRGNRLYTGLYLAAVAAGVLFHTSSALALADLFNAAMALPNLLALFLLRRDIER